MSHTVHPYAHRLGILRDWKSRWFGVKGVYQANLKADILLREYLEKRLRGFYVNSIEMERGQNNYKVIVKTARPGMVIGRNGEGSQKLQADIIRKLRKIGAENPEKVKLEIEEVRQPEMHAAIVASMVAEGLEKRFPHRRILKQTIEKVMANKEVEGVKVSLSGRLGGAEMGRKEFAKDGRIPLQTLRADVDFAREKAHLPYGDIGIKVWIYRGEILPEKKRENK
jgi:small subunit ribosomal protein S3